MEVHLAGNVHFGEQAITTAGVTSVLIGLGERVTWRAKHFGIWQTLISEITQLERPSHFQDVMIKGASRWMKHDRYFTAISENETAMNDVFRFAAPLPVAALFVEKLVLRNYMQNLLREKNLVIKQIAESPAWSKYIT